MNVIPSSIFQYYIFTIIINHIKLFLFSFFSCNNYYYFVNISLRNIFFYCTTPYSIKNKFILSGIMYDGLSELVDLSLQLQERSLSISA